LTALFFSLSFKQGGEVALCDNQLLCLIPQFPVFSQILSKQIKKILERKNPGNVEFPGFFACSLVSISAC
ncbi:MAG: hypothetical protein IKS06_00245, partial [Lachnospiraceae bacterium]|nr:hypothetical protein [Lachnospiraceae bacterium]